MDQKVQHNQSIIDPFNRQITYLRLSVTDRCDFRCQYCMAEEMTFLPKKDVLTLEECALIGKAFIELGVTKIRLTGGEPLIRHNFPWLTRELGKQSGLKELALTTNGSQLTRYADKLAASGITRINVSLDSLDADSFRKITRTGNLAKVLAGIKAAQQAGIERIKINAVAMKGFNEEQIIPLVDFCFDNSLDISFIEEMPLGNIDGHDRALTFMSSEEVRQTISQKYSLTQNDLSTGGPSRYWNASGFTNNIGFISPHTDNFCASCNRVRVTATGLLILCLGHEDSVDLRSITRQFPGEVEPIKQAIWQGIENKPEKHDFTPDDSPQVVRFMNMTGG